MDEEEDRLCPISEPDREGMASTPHRRVPSVSVRLSSSTSYHYYPLPSLSRPRACPAIEYFCLRAHMLVRNLRKLHGPLVCADGCLRPRVCRSALRLRLAHPAHYVTISDPPKPGGMSQVSMAHPMDPAGHAGSTPNSPETSPPPDHPPPAETSTNEATTSPSEQSSGQQPVVEASVPATYNHPPVEPNTNLPLPHPPPPPHTIPPFNTHEFVKVLERSFPVPIARNLMRACRAMLVDRQGRVKRDALTTQDLESVSSVCTTLVHQLDSQSQEAYLFKAALSELRSETSVFTRNETAAMRAATMALRREVDALGSRMKEDVATLKHE